MAAEVLPLKPLQIQRGETVTVFNLALQLWEAERSVRVELEGKGEGTFSRGA